MKTAIQGIGDLEIEIRQMEGRLGSVKSDVANLEKRKAALIEEANGIKLTVETDAARRTSEARQETARINVERDKFELNKKEFLATLTTLNQEKTAVQRAKEDAQNTIVNYKKMYEKLARFIIMVKRESELL